MRVLLGVDGSTSSDLAALMVANLVWPIGSTIKVMTAYPGTAALFSQRLHHRHDVVVCDCFKLINAGELHKLYTSLL